MEKVAVNGTSTGSRKQLRLAAGAVLALCAGAFPPAWAQSVQPADTVVAQARPDAPRTRLQVEANTVPHFDAQDASAHAPRVDLTLYPSRRYGLGAMVGMNGFAPNATPAAPPYLQPPRQSVDLGLRFSQRVQSQQIDIMAWRRMNTEDDVYSLLQRQPVYGARVEMNLSPGKSGFSALRGFLGFQLESGARISIRRSNGRPMIYYRTTF